MLVRCLRVTVYHICYCNLGVHRLKTQKQTGGTSDMKTDRLVQQCHDKQPFVHLIQNTQEVINDSRFTRATLSHHATTLEITCFVKESISMVNLLLISAG